MFVLLATMPAGAGSPNPSDLVKAELIADVTSIKAGSTFLLGARVKIAPNWHIYWLNPGDSGSPTVIDWRAPKGFNVEPLDYPVPKRFDLPGGLVNFGYSDEVMFMAKVTAPADLPAGKAMDFSASVSGLVCEELCLPALVEATLHLPAGNMPSPAHADLFAKWQSMLPVTPRLQDVQHSVVKQDSVSGPSGWLHDYRVALPEGSKDVQFFPNTTGEFTVEQVKVSKDGKSATVRFTVCPVGQADLSQVTIESVLSYTDATARRGVVLRSEVLPKN